MPRNYMTRHRGNIIKERVVAKSRFEPGHIITFKYSGEEATTANPIALVLNPRHVGKLHALALEHMSVQTLEHLITIVKLAHSAGLQAGRNMTILKLNGLLSKNPKIFYETKLRKFLVAHLKRTNVAYRTYLIKNIKSAKVVDYKFKKSIVDKYYKGAEK